MGHIDGRVAVLIVQAAHFEAHFLAQIGVEIRQRLVEQQRLRLHDQRAGERHPLLLAAREFARIALGKLAEANRREKIRHAPLDRAALHLAKAQAIGDVFGDRHMRPQRVALEDHRHVAPLRRHRSLRRGHDAAADEDFPRRGFDEARDQPERRGLAATGRAKQANQHAVLDLERNIVDDRRRAIALGQTPATRRLPLAPRCRFSPAISCP